MKRVSERWLHFLHLLYTSIAAIAILAYGIFNLLSPLHKYAHYVGTSPLIPIIPAAIIVYNFTYYNLKGRKKDPWKATMRTYLAITLFVILAIHPTGEYTSIYCYLWVVIAFFGGMLGIYAVSLPILLIMLRLLLTITGAYIAHSSKLAEAIAIGLLVVASIAGWLVWKRFYNDPNASKVNPVLEEELLKSDFILNAMTDGVMVVDPKQAIITFNKGAASITGWPQAEAIGLDYRSVIQLTDNKGKALPADADIIAKSFSQGEAFQDDQASLLTKSKQPISISMSVSPLVDKDKVVTACVIVFRDVSKERNAQQQRADFISTASHEMRTPVAAIEGYLALALNDKVSTVDSRARSFLEKAHTSTKSLGKLFQDLLTSAKADDGRLSNHPVVIEMTKFLEGLTNDLRFSAQKKGLTTNFSLGSAPGNVIDATSTQNKVVMPFYYVYVDPDRMREVITNLFDNAVKYTDRGKISIGVTADNQNVQFFIKDSGAGISADDIPHLFQKFYRIDNSATRTVGGTGLGLFICRRIVEMYHGRVWVESDLGKGSTFFVNLPRITDQQAQQLQAVEANNSSPLSPD